MSIQLDVWETTNLDYDHRQCVHVRLDGGTLSLAFVSEHVKELWSGPADHTPAAEC